MEQIAVSFTDGGVPKTGLTPKVNIIGRSGEVYVTNGVCKELGYGWYIYNFDKYNPEKVYLYQFDGGSELASYYDRYKFGGNEFDAYTNKYSWGRTAAPYFTNINGRFDSVDKSIKDAIKSRKEYNDSELKKSINEVKGIIKGKGGYDVYDGIDRILKSLEQFKKSVMDNSTINEGNSARNFGDLNEKLDFIAQYTAQSKEDIAKGMGLLGDVLSQSIQSVNDGVNNGATAEQLLQVVERLESKINEVVDAIISEKLPQELIDGYDFNIKRKAQPNPVQSQAVYGGLNEGMQEGLGAPRDEQLQAPVDMQGIAEPVMPETI